jgi:excisionase family DNA binding protein
MIKTRVSQLAKTLGVHRNTITNWIKSGKLNAVPTVGKKYLVSKDSLQQLCLQHGLSLSIIDHFNPMDSVKIPIQSNTENNHKTFIREAVMSEKPIGSVLVVGGGIAGIQATLDLAHSGYYVYLVEKSSGIGGVMAQLDKTYPTNDCAM